MVSEVEAASLATHTHTHSPTHSLSLSHTLSLSRLPTAVEARVVSEVEAASRAAAAAAARAGESARGGVGVRERRRGREGWRGREREHVCARTRKRKLWRAGSARTLSQMQHAQERLPAQPSQWLISLHPSITLSPPRLPLFFAAAYPRCLSLPIESTPPGAAAASQPEGSASAARYARQKSLAKEASDTEKRPTNR